MVTRDSVGDGRFLAEISAALLLSITMVGCDCFRYEYVSFESQPEFVVTERTPRFMGGSARTFPCVPTKYRLTRLPYVIEISTGGVPYPVLNIRTFDKDGNPLQISGPNMASRYGPRIQKGIERGEWAFDVLREGEKIGREHFHYEMRSRRFACDLAK